MMTKTETVNPIPRAVISVPMRRTHKLPKLYFKGIFIMSLSDNAEARNDLGTVFMALGELGKAPEVLKEAVNAKPDFVLPHYNLGLVHISLSERDAALEDQDSLPISLNMD